MIFRLIGSLIKLTTRQFFRRITVSGAAIVRDRPVIYAANHHNQAVDSFVMGTVVERDLYFIAKSTLFANPILAKFLASLHMLPIYRRIDNSDMSKNQDTFAAVCQKLLVGGAVLIFPEGTSTERRVLLPIKTGAARIALQAVSQAGTNLGICVQPVSITYENIYSFQSAVTVTAAEPIDAAQYLPQYQQAASAAVDRLTQDLESSLRAITVHIEKERHQPIVELVSSLFNDSTDERELFTRVTRAVEKLADRNDAKVAGVLKRLELLQLKRGHGIFAPTGTNSMRAWQLFVLTPAVVLGAVTICIPYQIVRLLVRFLVSDRHNLASVKIVSSLIIYPLWYLIFFLLGLSYCGLVVAAGMLAAALFVGWSANRYWDRVCLAWRARVFRSEAERLQALSELRAELLRIELLAQSATPA